MSERKRFELTTEQLNTLLDAGKPTPVMYLSGGKRMFDSPQENANRAWRSLGDDMGFDYMSVKPIAGEGQQVFTALATENKNE